MKGKDKSGLADVPATAKMQLMTNTEKSLLNSITDPKWMVLVESFYNSNLLLQEILNSTKIPKHSSSK